MELGFSPGKSRIFLSVNSFFLNIVASEIFIGPKKKIFARIHKFLSVFLRVSVPLWWI